MVQWLHSWKGCFVAFASSATLGGVGAYPLPKFNSKSPWKATENPIGKDRPPTHHLSGIMLNFWELIILQISGCISAAPWLCFNWLLGFREGNLNPFLANHAIPQGIFGPMSFPDLPRAAAISGHQGVDQGRHEAGRNPLVEFCFSNGKNMGNKNNSADDWLYVWKWLDEMKFFCGCLG